MDMDITGFCVLSLIVILVGLVSCQQVEQGSLCLSSQGYTTQLKCSADETTIKVVGISYGLNTDECTDACCVDKYISCQRNETIPQSVIDKCNNRKDCLVTSEAELMAIDLTCEVQTKKATFAVISYLCIIQQTTTPTTTTTTQEPQDTTKGLTKKGIPLTTSTIDDSDQKDREKTTPILVEELSSSVVIGVSVAAGVVLIAVVVIVVVIVIMRRKRSRFTDRSHNSTKTLASSDVESGGSREDPYGFGAATEDRQERLKKRNDNIKRNLSIRSEDKKNKRPAKIPKSKAKGKSSSQDKLNKNNSNKKNDKLAHKTTAKEKIASKETKSTTKDL